MPRKKPDQLKSAGGSTPAPTVEEKELARAPVEAPAAQPEMATATATATDDKSKASADDILAMIRARQSK